MKNKSSLVVVKCKKCGKEITTMLSIVSEKQCICKECCTLIDEYKILDEQAELKGFKK